MSSEAAELEEKTGAQNNQLGGRYKAWCRRRIKRIVRLTIEDLLEGKAFWRKRNSSLRSSSHSALMQHAIRNLHSLSFQTKRKNSQSQWRHRWRTTKGQKSLWSPQWILSRLLSRICNLLTPLTLLNSFNNSKITVFIMKQGKRASKLKTPPNRRRSY